MAISTEEDEIDDIKDANGVDDEKRDEPERLLVAGSVPERKAFPSDRPESDDKSEAGEGADTEHRTEAMHEGAVHSGEYSIIRYYVMRYLGIDFGTKKVGLALSDEAGTMGFPKEVVSNDSRLLETVRALIARENVGAVVMGDSQNSEGDDNPVMTSARAFASELETDGTTVYFEPEAYTSAEARRARDASNEGRSPKNTDNVDASAAALILTSYLSRHGAN